MHILTYKYCPTQQLFSEAVIDALRFYGAYMQLICLVHLHIQTSVAYAYNMPILLV